MRKKPIAAGSLVEPAGTKDDAALNVSAVAGSGAQSSENLVVAKNDAAESPGASDALAVVEAVKREFPRSMVIVNDTAMEFVVARVHMPAGSRAPVRVNDADELTRITTDCEQIMSLSDHYKDAEVSPLRVVEADE